METSNAAVLPTSAGGLVPGRFLRRGCARLIDFGFLIAVGLVAGVIAGIALALLAALGHAPADWVSEVRKVGFLHNLVWGLISSTLYATTCEALGATTLGKVLLGLRVATPEGTRIGAGAALIRNLVYPLDALFFGLVAYSAMSDSPLQQRYGDRWADTAVVLGASLPPATRPSRKAITLALLAGAAVKATLSAGALILAVLT
jgi:uncharacterized RDD family membrane protein YckC